MKARGRLIEIVCRVSGSADRDEALHIINVNTDYITQLERILKNIISFTGGSNEEIRQALNEAHQLFNRK